MPNWCNNNVTFKHEDPAKIQRLVTAYNENRLLSEFYPCPEELSEATPVGEDFVARDQKRQEDNIAKYGYPDWYSWKVSNWGTKWDVESVDEVEIDEGATEVTVYFDSAWSPPIEWYEHMVEECGFSVKAYYYESGMAFCGLYEDGDNNEYEITGDSNWVVDHIPAAINDIFCIAESMEMWEEEEAEEEDKEIKPSDDE